MSEDIVSWAFVGIFLNYWFNSLLGIIVFGFFISSWFSLGRLYISRNLSIPSRLFNLLVYNCLMILRISLVSVVTTLSFLIYLSLIFFSWFPLGFTGLISLLPKRLWRAFSSTTIQKHWFFGIQPSLWSNYHICTWLMEKP